MLPGMKAARLIYQASNSHQWAERNCIDFKWYHMLLMRLSFVMPGITATLWVSASLLACWALPAEGAGCPWCRLSVLCLMAMHASC